MRTTRQRTVLMDILQNSDRPLSPYEILEMGQEKIPEMGIATVYRNLAAMAKADTINVVELPKTTARYYAKGLEDDIVFYSIVNDTAYFKQSVPAEFEELGKQIIVTGI